MQTPGCPVTALYHPDDRKAKFSAKVSTAEALVSILAYVTINTLGGCCDDGEHFKTTLKVLMQEREYK